MCSRSEVRFSDVCGENVKISDDKTTATWIAKNSSGWVCCEETIKLDDVIQVTVDGSGRCDIGFMTGEQNSSSFKILNEIRAHRRSCDIEMTCKEQGDEMTISSKFAERTFKKKTTKETTCWIAVYIRYGDMSVKICTKGTNQSSLKFSATCGKNIKLENDNTKASSISRNPASICFLSQRLQVGETLQLACAPEKEGERHPSRYDIKLQICENDPTTLRDDFKHLFDVIQQERSNAPLTTIESFEKDDCNGNIDITLSEDNVVVYRTASGKQNSQILKFKAESGVWIVFNLYRIRIQSSKSGPLSGEVEGTPLDQPDSIPVPPRVTVVPREGEARQPQPVALTATNGNNSHKSDHEQFLEDRVKRLEEELKGLKGQREKSEATSNPRQEVPKHISNSDPNVLNEELGDDLNVQKNYPELIQSIDTLPLCDHLYANKILTEAQMETVHSVKRHSQSDANRELLKILKTKRIEKSVMIKILDKTQQLYLLKLFYPRP